MSKGSRIALIVLLSLRLAACFQSPAAPSRYLCTTQLRGYFMANADTGEVFAETKEIDHYVSATPCPAVPIQ
jgi:hypothetical protein